jgi:ATP-dependent DNA helicase UvrD/PcrA
MLVVGPPGSGKTVVGHFRAARLRGGREPVELLMYNHVLRRYTGSAETFYSWINTWWRKATGRKFPQMQVPSGQRSNRVWDFVGALEAVRGEMRDPLRRAGHWGHVILDEAQDFTRDAHRLLFVVQNIVFAEEHSKPSLMILADENQRIKDHNSTIKEINQAHMLGPKDLYHLTKNYRNTREIALLSQRFYVGLPSGIPDLPDARGEKPVLIATNGVDQAVDRIARYAQLNAQQEIGVLVYYDATRRKLFNKLKHRLAGSGVRVQTYTSRDSGMADKLRFDTSGVLTVLCYASSKGLEFDAVFLPELQTVPVEAEHADTARMQFYVMTSRARSRLFLMITDQEGEATIWNLLPSDGEIIDREQA